MVCFDIRIVRLGINHRGVNVAVAQETLYLFNRHAGSEGRGGCRMPEHMRSNMCSDAGTVTDF